MATLSMFFGIIVRMNREDGGQHHKPHIHAWHAGKTASFDIETGAPLAGEMDADDEAMVRSWIKIHREELFANWLLLSNGEPFFKIEPLR
jgi:hypothetical protein